MDSGDSQWSLSPSQTHLRACRKKLVEISSFSYTAARRIAIGLIREDFMKSKLSVSDILKGSDHALTIFSEKEVKMIDLWDKEGKPYLTCAASDRPRPAKPEEIVRQLYLKKLMTYYGYPKDRIAVEKPVYFGSAIHEKAADIVVWEKDAPNTPYIIVEVKKPKRKDGLEQLKGYCNAEGSPIGVWTNGGETIALHREEPNIFRNLPDIPSVTQRLTDMLSERWTLEDLESGNKLVTERRSLRGIIQDMEDLVLANAGVDAFEEVFKLIYAKLYDEWQAARGGKSKRYLEFRVGGSTAKEFADKGGTVATGWQKLVSRLYRLGIVDTGA